MISQAYGNTPRTAGASISILGLNFGTIDLSITSHFEARLVSAGTASIGELCHRSLLHFLSNIVPLWPQHGMGSAFLLSPFWCRCAADNFVGIGLVGCSSFGF